MAFHKWIEASAGREASWKVCLRILDSRLEAVSHYLPLAAKKASLKEEYVHQLRVWSRRADAAVKLCEPLISKKHFAKLTKQLKMIRRAARDARDADVFLDKLRSLKEGAGREFLLSGLSKARSAAQQSIAAANEELRGGKELFSVLAKIEKQFKERRDHKKLKRPFKSFARERFALERKNFLNAASGDFTDVGALHQFRIAGKRLRYTMELLVSAFPAAFRKRLYPQLDRIQTQLGIINDANDFLERFRGAIELSKKRVVRSQLQRLLDEEHFRFVAAREAWDGYWIPERLVKLCRLSKKLLEND